MHAQSGRHFYARSHSGMNSGSQLLSALASLGLLCWPVMCGAQMVGPMPQPQGTPAPPIDASPKPDGIQRFATMRHSANTN
jgi:hypothetical protein